MEFAVAVLRHSTEDGEGLVRSAVPLGHEDAFGLFDHRTVFHRGLHVLGQCGGGVVQVRVGQCDRGVAGEGLREHDRVVVESARFGGVQVQRADDAFVDGQGDRQ
jgi:hypothetical protein